MCNHKPLTVMGVRLLLANLASYGRALLAAPMVLLNLKGIMGFWMALGLFLIFGGLAAGFWLCEDEPEDELETHRLDANLMETNRREHDHDL